MLEKTDVFKQLHARLRPLWIAMVVGVPATPAAVLALQGVAVYRRGMPPGGVVGLLPGFAFWTVAMWIVIGIAGVLLIRRARRKIAAAQALIEAGTRQPGVVTDITTSQRQASGVTMNALHATVRCEDGQEHRVSIEEPIGTELPPLDEGEAVTVWVSDRGVAAATARAVLTRED